MEFDHVPERGPKLFTIANGRGRSRGVLTREIAKCDMVCRSCHLKRTIARGIAYTPSNPMPGERNPQAKLTAVQVLEIRRLSALGVSRADLGRRFGVSAMMVSRIARRENWTHI